MVYIYTDGNDFGQWGYNWYACPYFMPGTTVNLAARVDKNIHPVYFNSSPYAGGVEQGVYASAGFILGYTEKAYSSATFSSQNAAKISAKKSYFMFDNEIVCIGSDIRDVSGENVVTVVDNRTWGLRSGKVVTDVLHINGELISSPAVLETTKGDKSPNCPETVISARTMHFTGMGGYVFMRYSDSTAEDLDGNLIKYQKATRYPYDTSNATNLDATNDFLEIVIDHGTGNSSLNGKYAYIYLPGATVEETESYYADQDVILLRRTSNVHAVLEKKLDALAVNFFAEDTGEKVEVKGNNTQYTKIRSISSSTPSCVMVSKADNGQYVISVSEPTQTFHQVVLEIEIDGVSEVVSKDGGVTATVEDGTVYVSVITDGSNGASFDITVK